MIGETVLRENRFRDDVVPRFMLDEDAQAEAFFQVDGEEIPVPVADEMAKRFARPRHEGGNGRAPTPQELLEAWLAADQPRTVEDLDK